MDEKILDLKDRKILYMLCQEARTPPSIIAKQVGLSKDAVKYRIKRLEKKGVIAYYLTEVNIAPLRYTNYDLFLKFNMPPSEEHKISEYFNSHPNIIWSCYLAGEWTYYVELMCSSEFDFHRITKDISRTFSEQLEDFDFYIVGDTHRETQLIESLYDGKDMALKDIVSPTEFPAGEEKIVLDETEKKILGVMSERATLPIHKIAEETGLTSEVVRYRIKKLRNERIIIRTTPVINYKLMGYNEHIMIINLRKLTEASENRIIMRVRNMTNIKFAYRTAGKQAIFALMNTKTMDELESIIKELKLEFHEIIKSISFYHIISHERFLLFPDVLRR